MTTYQDMSLEELILFVRDADDAQASNAGDEIIRRFKLKERDTEHLLEIGKNQPTPLPTPQCTPRR